MEAIGKQNTILLMLLPRCGRGAPAGHVCPRYDRIGGPEPQWFWGVWGPRSYAPEPKPVQWIAMVVEFPQRSPQKPVWEELRLTSRAGNIFNRLKPLVMTQGTGAPRRPGQEDAAAAATASAAAGRGPRPGGRGQSVIAILFLFICRHLPSHHGRVGWTVPLRSSPRPSRCSRRKRRHRRLSRLTVPPKPASGLESWRKTRTIPTRIWGMPW